MSHQISKPITRGGVERRYKMCVCSRCGIVAVCRPNFDFYAGPNEEDQNLLRCERCAQQDWAKALQCGAKP